MILKYNMQLVPPSPPLPSSFGPSLTFWLKVHVYIKYEVNLLNRFIFNAFTLKFLTDVLFF